MVLQARSDGAVAALRSVLGDADAVARAAAPLQEAAARSTWSGLALGGANAALPWPDDPYAVLFHAATVLREIRGDAHVAAQVVAGLSGLEAMVLRSLQDIEREMLQPLAAGVTRSGTPPPTASSSADSSPPEPSLPRVRP